MREIERRAARPKVYPACKKQLALIRLGMAREGKILDDQPYPATYDIINIYECYYCDKVHLTMDDVNEQ